GFPVLFAFSVAPTVSDSADRPDSAAVADAVRVGRESSLPNETTSMFTTIERKRDEVMPVSKPASEAVAEHSPRVSLVLKADLRPGYENQLSAKVERVEQHLRPE